MTETITSDTTDTITGREFLRVSFDRSGRERSNDEQHTENTLTWQGWRWGEPYREVGSASKYATKERDDFPKLLADLESGRFAADVLVMWEATRGSRKVSEWLALIEACEERGVRIGVTSDEHIYDPANPRDRKALIEAAADGEYEVAKTSKRVRRDMATAAAEGRPHGRHTFGFERIYDAKTRELVEVRKHREQAPLVAELFDRLRSGHSLKSIARDWEAKGVRNRSGRPFSSQHLGDMARNPIYAGLRTHHGEIYDAVWPALVDKAVFYAVQGILSDPARRTSRSGRAKHFLSGIAACDECGGKLSVEWRGGRPIYRCAARRCVTVGRDALDDLAERVIVAYLSDPNRAEALTADDRDNVELAQVRDELAEARAELDDWRDKARRREVSAGSFAAIEPGILDDISRLEGRERELSTPSKLRGLIPPGVHIERHWATMPIEARRDVARIVLSPDYVGQLRVTRAPAHGTPVEDRVGWRREDG